LFLPVAEPVRVWPFLPVTHRPATLADLPLLAELNHQLIRDEGHRNRMTVSELAVRLQGWLTSGEYRATVFEADGEVAAYALYREQPAEIYLRQFFVARDRRTQSVGRTAMQLLLTSVWPGDKRLTVEVLAGNAPGIAFYRSLGFADYSLALEILPRGEPKA
jgi:ribosomal protein S18 acetylase RimI-like enzyme